MAMGGFNFRGETARHQIDGLDNLIILLALFETEGEVKVYELNAVYHFGQALLCLFLLARR